MAKYGVLKLYKELIKKRRMNIEQVVNAVEIAIHKVPYMENLYKQAKDQAEKMQRTVQRLETYLHTLNDEIASAKALLNSYHKLCERKRQELENINNEASRIVTLVNRFKNNNEEYIEIKKTVEEEVSKFLTDGKVLLQFALASVIEAIRRDSDKYNNLLVYNVSAASSSTAIPAQDLPLSHIEDYKDMILEEAKRLYDSLLHHFTNSIMDNTAAKSSSSDPKLSSTFPDLANKSDTYE
jgi:F0F1-type ATP synthase membrane subunit b/b'